jgi:hypothetical protein
LAGLGATLWYPRNDRGAGSGRQGRFFATHDELSNRKDLSRVSCRELVDNVDTTVIDGRTQRNEWMDAFPAENMSLDKASPQCRKD